MNSNEAANPTLNGKRVLVVEDDVSLLRIVSTALTRRGAIVTQALNGQEAIDLLEDDSFDLVLSDIQMPIVDGLALLAEIRRQHAGRPPVLFMTGQSSVSKDEIVRLGAVDLLSKPVRMAELVASVSRYAV